MPNRKKEVITDFIFNTIWDKPFISLTTDGFTVYKSVTNDANVIHQNCIFHQRWNDNWCYGVFKEK
jgi:hypothetical protein